jgi:hypothetical protein
VFWSKILSGLLISFLVSFESLANALCWPWQNMLNASFSVTVLSLNKMKSACLQNYLFWAMIFLSSFLKVHAYLLVVNCVFLAFLRTVWIVQYIYFCTAPNAPKEVAKTLQNVTQWLGSFDPGFNYRVNILLASYKSRCKKDIVYEVLKRLSSVCNQQAFHNWLNQRDGMCIQFWCEIRGEFLAKLWIVSPDQE